MNETLKKKMSKVVSDNPNIGRYRLVELSGCTAHEAMKFLHNNRGVKKKGRGRNSDDILLEAIDEAKLSKKEREKILSSLKVPGLSKNRTVRKWGKKKFKFGVISDTHIGEKNFVEEWLLGAFDYFKSEQVDWIYHPGDILEGMSGRGGQIYELAQIGYGAQKGYAVELFKQAPRQIRAIDGNHDMWYKEKENIGVIVGDELQKELGESRFKHLGQHEGDDIVGNVHIKLWHGSDGSIPYAKGYRLQKIIESFSGGEKPNILLGGHTHKTEYAFIRNVHAYECATLSKQSLFMRGKRLAAEPGFWVIEVTPSKVGVERIKSEFVPYYIE